MRPQPFANPVWDALHGPHRQFALGTERACRYPADVAPFAALVTLEAQALRELHSLLRPGESVWLFGEHGEQTAEAGLKRVETLECLQMMADETALRASTALVATSRIRRLTPADAPAMVELTDLAFPGFFRARTHAMGTYYGVVEDGALVAMGGERLMLERYPEISGVCTHPAHRAKGHARSLIGQLMRDHNRAEQRSWLHVGAANTRAAALYASLGFATLGRVRLERLQREP